MGVGCVGQSQLALDSSAVGWVGQDCDNARAGSYEIDGVQPRTVTCGKDLGHGQLSVLAAELGDDEEDNVRRGLEVGVRRRKGKGAVLC